MSKLNCLNISLYASCYAYLLEQALSIASWHAGEQLALGWLGAIE
jgi:hypothetical protein